MNVRLIWVERFAYTGNGSAEPGEPGTRQQTEPADEIAGEVGVRDIGVDGRTVGFLM